MNILERKKQLVDEFNQIEARQKEIVGALKVLEEIEKEEKVKVKVEPKK